MIGILSNRLDEAFVENINLKCIFISEFDIENLLDFDGLFIDWVPKVSGNEVAWIKQVTLLQSYIKSDIPIVIFDRSLSLTKREVDWCKKFNVYFFEPYLNSGRGDFIYLPEWINDCGILIGNEDRHYDVVYFNNRLEWQLKGFEKWIQKYAEIFNNKKVAYATMDISDFNKNKFLNSGILFRDILGLIYNEGNFTVAFDTTKAYKTGYFDPRYLFAMNLGCMPLLPVEHKYFHGMFDGLVISDMKEMDYYVSSFKYIKNVLIEEIFDRIKNEWNEFTLQHAVDVIKNCYVS